MDGRGSTGSEGAQVSRCKGSWYSALRTRRSNGSEARIQMNLDRVWKNVGTGETISTLVDRLPSFVSVHSDLLGGPVRSWSRKRNRKLVGVRVDR